MSPSSSIFPASTAKDRSVLVSKHLRDVIVEEMGRRQTRDTTAHPPSMRGNAMGTPATSDDFRGKAAECERMAGKAIDAEHRNTMLYLAARWRALADEEAAKS
jgi:hypothetical protein